MSYLSPSVSILHLCLLFLLFRLRPYDRSPFFFFVVAYLLGCLFTYAGMQQQQQQQQCICGHGHNSGIEYNSNPLRCTPQHGVA